MSLVAKCPRDNQTPQRAAGGVYIPWPLIDVLGMAFELHYSHSLPDAEARARMNALGQYLGNKYGLTVRWTGEDEAKIMGKYLVVTIDGSLSLSPGRVHFSGKDPGMLWRGKAKDYLHGKLGKYLDAGTPLDALPRG